MTTPFIRKHQAFTILNGMSDEHATTACFEYLQGTYPALRDIFVELHILTKDTGGDIEHEDAFAILDDLQKAVSRAVGTAESVSRDAYEDAEHERIETAMLGGCDDQIRR